MDNFMELLNQNKFKEVYDFLDKKIQANTSLLGTLFKLEISAELSKEGKKIIEIMNEIRNSKHKWLLDMLAQSSFEIIRNEKEFEKLTSQIKTELSSVHKARKIDLVENQWIEIELTNPEKELPKADVSLSFDEEYFKIKAKVHDNHFLDGNRSWRYGDGFYLNFTLPEGAEKEECVDTKRFYSLGFSREKGKPIGVLVNHNNVYYLSNNEELTPEIEIDADKKVAKYTINIPFSFLKPFNPLVDEVSGFSIRYTSQEDKDTRTRISNIEDMHADSELVKTRRFVPVTYTFAKDSPLKISGILNTRSVQNNQLEFDIHIHSPEVSEENLEIKIINKEKDAILEISNPVKIQQGKQIISENIHIKHLDSGIYEVSIKLSDKEWKQTFFKFSKDRIENLQEEIQNLKQIDKGTLIENSIYTLEFQLQEIDRLISDFHPRDDPEIISNQIEKIKQSIADCQKNKSLFKHSGYLLSAFKSQHDNTLQPYSFVLPENFDPEKEYHMLVALHGSGVSEVGFTRYMGKNLAELGATNLIILAPRGRNLSDYYVGQTELDVVDLIKTVKTMFKIKKTLIFGFSMGGYGSWRLSLKYPELFESAIVAAGMPWFDSNPENDMKNYIDKPNEIEYLVIHSDDDRAVTIEKTDEFIDKLKTNGFSVVYERLTGMDHGEMDVGAIIGKWLMNYLQ